MRVTSVLLGLSCLLRVAPGALAGEFIPGRVYVTVEEGDNCEFGGEEGILEIDPLTGETSIFADSDDGLCNASGLRFTPDGTHLRVLNAGHLLPVDLGWVQEFEADGASQVILDATDGLRMPFGYNGLAFDTDGNFYVVNTFPGDILRFPADGGPAEVFADEDDGPNGRGALDFDPISGDLFYAGDKTGAIIRITPEGEASVFDDTPCCPVTLVFDSKGNLFVGTELYQIYRYDQADPTSGTLIASGFSEPLGFPVALTISPDDAQLYFAVGAYYPVGGLLYGVDPEDGSTTLLADFSVFAEQELSIFLLPTGIAVYDPAIATQCEGDANHDGTVDPLDSGFVLARFGCMVGLGDPDCDTADQNGDGTVDPLDSGFVLARFGDCP